MREKSSKYIYIIVLLFCSLVSALAQNNSGIHYQGLLMNESNQPLNQKSITVKLSFFDKANTLWYREYHETKTSSAGFFDLVIGKGKILKGNWDDIPWLSSSIQVKIEMDTLKNTNYYLYAEHTFASVPYARYAERANTRHFRTDENGDLYWSMDSAFYILSAQSPQDTLIALFPDGRIGIGMGSPRDGIELAVNKRIHLSSEEWHLDKSGVITLQALNDSAKPALSWYDEFGNIHAALTTYDRAKIDPKHHKQFVVETDNGKGEMLPRFAILYGYDWTEIRTHNGDFRVGDGGDFYLGKSDGAAGNAYLYGNVFTGRRMGIGKKNWNVKDPFLNTNSLVELYAQGSNAEMRIIQEDTSKKAAFRLIRGENQWEIAHQNNLRFLQNDTLAMSFSPDGKIGIGTDQPQEALDVKGNVLAEGSFMVPNSLCALYFEAEEVFELGDVAGLNPLTGKIRKYRAGDYFVGISCDKAGVIANYTADKKNNAKWALVAVSGEVKVTDTQIKKEKNKIMTTDDVHIGYQLSSGKLYLP